jgi:hypothetical protein
MYGSNVSFTGGYYEVSNNTASTTSTNSSASAPGKDTVLQVTWAIGDGNGTVHCWLWWDRLGNFQEDASTAWAAPKPLSLPDWQPYLAALPTNLTEAGAKLAADVLSGGSAAQLAIATLVASPNRNALQLQFILTIVPKGKHLEASVVLLYVRAWQEAADALGVPVCTTVAVVNASNALLVEQTTVHSPINATAGGSPLPEPAPAPSSQPAPAGDNATVAEVRTGWNVGHLGPVECTYYEPKPAPAFVNIPDKQGYLSTASGVLIDTNSAGVSLL